MRVYCLILIIHFSGGGSAKTFPRVSPSKTRGEPNLRRVILSEFEYYRSSNNKNYESNQVFQDFNDGAKTNHKDDPPPPPLPPKKSSGRGRAYAMEKQISLTTKTLDVRDNSDTLSKSIPKTLFLFDPLATEPDTKSTEPTLADEDWQGTAFSALDLLDFDGDEKEQSDDVLPNLPPKKYQQVNHLSTKGATAAVSPRLTERRKVKTLSPEDLNQFEKGNTKTPNKSVTLPVRPPPPQKNRFSCPPSVQSGDSKANEGRCKSPNNDNSSKFENRNNGNIYFTNNGLFQKTEERNEEAVAFSNSIAELRKVYRHEDKKTNPGFFSAALIPNKALLNSTAVVTIYFDPEYTDRPKVLDCKLSCTPVDLIHMFFTECYCNDSKGGGNSNCDLDIISHQYVLKFVGATTCLIEQCPLCDYVTVQECIKYGYKIELVLARTGFVNLDFKRDADDDAEDCQATYFKYFFEEKEMGGFSISEQGLMVLLETYNNEAARLMQDVDDSHKVSYLPERLIQVVKAVAKSLAQVELLSIQEGVNMLLSLKTFTVRDTQRVNEFINPMHFDRDRFHFALQMLTRGVHSLIELYCKFFNTDFKIQDFKTDSSNDQSGSSGGDSDVYERIDPRSIDDKFSVRIGAIHRIPSSWKQDFSEFEIETGLFYGGKPTCRVLKTSRSRICIGFFEHIQFNKFLEFDLNVQNVPREAKVTFKLVGISHSKKGSDGRTVLGWVSSNVYDHQGFLVSGSRLFGLIPAADVDFNPVATCATGYIQKANTVILKTDFQLYHTEVLFPQPMLVTQRSINSGRHSSLSEAEQKYMKKLINKSSRLLTEEERHMVWNSRHDLCHLPHALKHVLTSCPSWDPVNMHEVHLILSSWESLSPNEAIEFLQADFPDKIVREIAVLWLSSISDDDLVDYLPELVQAIKYEAYHDSALAQFLIKRSLSSTSVCHFLFWHLKYYTGDLQFSQRFQIVLSGLLSACGRRMRTELQRQDRLIIELASVSHKVKLCKETNRQYTLVKELEQVNLGDSIEFPVRSPINPALKLGEILPEKSSFFASHTVPLKVSMANVDRRGRTVDFIFKIGDDLRKDLVTLLMFRVMNKLWLNEGLDLKMMLYDVLPTGPMSGLIEIVPNSSTFREIHIQHGLTGSFKDDSLLLWLQRFNTTEEEHQRAVQNFTASAAGYCVATYLLGIGDRHNDNIMLTKNGHLFHIDFSKFMGDVQKFGAISRDRVPFVFTPDMAYVINKGVTPTQNFQTFIEYCCRAFNIIRRNKHVILNLLGLMVYSGIPYLSEKEDLMFVLKNLQLDLNDDEATIYFTRLIESSLSSRSTQLNFFIHNIAQMKNMSEATLASSKCSPFFSFTNKTYTSAQDGRVESARIVDFQKRYLPEKHYVFVINVLRESTKDAKFVFRRYEDFQELHAKLSYKFNLFTGIILPELPARILFGRSQIREVAHRRRYQLDGYLVALSKIEDVWESDIVSTFLHSYIKDVEEARRFADYVELLAEGPKTRIGGQIKLSIAYKDQALHVSVMHCAKLVPGRLQGLSDSFVRVKILPDPLNYFKRKTRICRKTLNPTFNEILVFDADWELLRRRVMQITVWDSSNMMEKEFLGGINFYLSTFDVKKAVPSSWFPLTDIQVS